MARAARQAVVAWLFHDGKRQPGRAGDLRRDALAQPELIPDVPSLLLCRDSSDGTQTLIGLIGIDVDGTLVGRTGVVPEFVWAAAERARAAGIRLALCSGRPAFGIARDYARRLDAAGWHMFQNGASVVHLPTGESRSTPLPQERVQELIAQAREW